MAEGGFTVTKMCISTAAAVGEMTADGDKAMVDVVFCFVRDCAETASVLVYGTVPLHCKRIVSKNHHSVSKTVRKKKLLTNLLTAPNGRSPWEESTILSHFFPSCQEEF